MTGLDDLLKEDILTIGMRADDLRRAGPSGARVFYQRVHVLRAAEVQESLTVPEEATEVRLLASPETLEDALNLVRAIKEAAGERPVTAFSLARIIEHAKTGWGDARTVLTQLASAGLSDLAEIPVDRLDDLNAAIEVARAAGLRGQRLTIDASVSDRKSEVLDRIRLCVGGIGGITHVSPLPRNVAQDKPTTGYEDVRMVALTRLTVGNFPRPPFVAVDWSLYGPKLAQVALTFGADFLDAVPATSDESLGKRRATVADVERNIRAAGFEPREFRPER